MTLTTLSRQRLYFQHYAGSEFFPWILGDSHRVINAIESDGIRHPNVTNSDYP